MGAINQPSLFIEHLLYARLGAGGPHVSRTAGGGHRQETRTSTARERGLSGGFSALSQDGARQAELRPKGSHGWGFWVTGACRGLERQGGCKMGAGLS